MPSLQNAKRFPGHERDTSVNHLRAVMVFRAEGLQAPSIPVGRSQLSNGFYFLEANTACLEQAECKELELGANRPGSRKVLSLTSQVVLKR